MWKFETKIPIYASAVCPCNEETRNTKWKAKEIRHLAVHRTETLWLAGGFAVSEKTRNASHKLLRLGPRDILTCWEFCSAAQMRSWTSSQHWKRNDMQTDMARQWPKKNLSGGLKRFSNTPPNYINRKIWFVNFSYISSFICTSEQR